ncbi:MAG: Polysaccharide biosynthesis protein [Rhodanobacteraceae bacterium]|jgi:O-antigen/teichoic acid export membrane protein|nr:MAG: Polysaccharide biosynthesis protein [Rhodanobacteraceae bacterium]
MTGPIARGTIRTTFVLGLRLLVQAGTLLLVARMLGPQQFGAFAGVAALAVMLGTLATFGTHLVLLGEVSREPERREQVLSYAIPTTLMCGGALLIVYLLICMLALRESGVALPVLLAIGITEMWLQPLFGFPATEHLALGRIARSQMLQTLPLALRLVAAASVFLLKPADPLAAYGYGYLVASLLALGFATFTMPSPWPPLSRWCLPKTAELRETAGYAALAITATSPAELDKTLAAKLLPLGAAGVYAAGARVIGAATLPVVAMMLSALPRLFREGQDQPKRTTHLLRWIFGAALAYSLALAVVLWFISPVFDWLFGAKYHGIAHTIHWLCLAVPGMALRVAAGSVLMALGRPWMRVAFEVLGLATLAVAALLLTPRMGAIGMPVALAFAEWVMAIVGGILVSMAAGRVQLR